MSGGGEWVAGDACDAAALDRLCKGADAVVHLVGIIREVRGNSARPQTFERMHVQATQAAIDAAKRSNIRRYVQMSALGVGPEGRSAYQKTKWAAEQAVRRSGLEWTIFRPSLIHGPGSEFITMLTELASGEKPPYFFIPYFVRAEEDRRVPMRFADWEPAKVQPVAVEDVAYAFAESLDALSRSATSTTSRLGGARLALAQRDRARRGARHQQEDRHVVRSGRARRDGGQGGDLHRSRRAAAV